MGIEWETIIKTYRDFLGAKSFDTFEEKLADIIKGVKGKQKKE
jgi:hypothetical protein